MHLEGTGDVGLSAGRLPVVAGGERASILRGVLLAVAAPGVLIGFTVVILFSGGLLEDVNRSLEGSVLDECWCGCVCCCCCSWSWSVFRVMRGGSDTEIGVGSFLPTECPTTHFGSTSLGGHWGHQPVAGHHSARVKAGGHASGQSRAGPLVCVCGP